MTVKPFSSLHLHLFFSFLIEHRISIRHFPRDYFRFSNSPREKRAPGTEDRDWLGSGDPARDSAKVVMIHENLQRVFHDRILNSGAGGASTADGILIRLFACWEEGRSFSD